MFNKIKQSLKDLKNTDKWYLKLLFGSHLSLYISVLVWLVLTSWNPIFYRDEVLKLMGVYLLAGIGYGYLVFTWFFYIYKKIITEEKKLWTLLRGLMLGLHIVLIFIIAPFILSVYYYNLPLNIERFQKPILDESLEKFIILEDAYLGLGFSDDKTAKLKTFQDELFFAKYNVSFIKLWLTDMINYYGIRIGYMSEKRHYTIYIINEYVKDSIILLKNSKSYESYLISNSGIMSNALDLVYDDYMNTRDSYNHCTPDTKFLSLKTYNQMTDEFMKPTSCLSWNRHNIILYNFMIHYFSSLKQLFDMGLINSDEFNRDKVRLKGMILSLLQDKYTSVYFLNHETVNTFLEYID